MYDKVNALKKIRYFVRLIIHKVWQLLDNTLCIILFFFFLHILSWDVA